MALVVWRGSIFKLQIQRIEGAVGERYLIVVRKVECFGKRIRRAQLIVAVKTLFKTHKQAVVLCSNTRLQICNCIRTTYHRIEDTSDCATDDEVCAEVVQVIDAKNGIVSKLSLKTQIHLLHHWVLH